MTYRQIGAVQVLSRCRIGDWKHRERVKAWRLMLECDPDLEMDSWEDGKLWYYFHRYRRQHGLCRCDLCFSGIVGRPPPDPVDTGQLGLFGPGGDGEASAG